MDNISNRLATQRSSPHWQVEISEEDYDKTAFTSCQASSGSCAFYLDLRTHQGVPTSDGRITHDSKVAVCTGILTRHCHIFTSSKGTYRPCLTVPNVIEDGVTLNRKTCKFFTNEIVYQGLLISHGTLKDLIPTFENIWDSNVKGTDGITVMFRSL